MTGKIIAIVVILHAIAPVAPAQGLIIGLDGGWQGMRYPLQNRRNNLRPAGSLDLFYSFRLAGNWDLLTGVSGGIYRTQAVLPDGTVFTNYQVDDAGSAFQYEMKTTGYKETQRFFAA